ncbi:MAG: hypothetical protein HOJ87_03130 [Rhodospirillaceae bacterium]|jgi:hypothetical protein|nr:hypothetical protein [Rhodospirillaceae bacterium]MBT6243396.1 hypothetical protein [Rhodospirillaceae bacterium]
MIFNNWLVEAFKHSISHKYCMKPSCTTCGCHYFRIHLCKAACKNSAEVVDISRFNFQKFVNKMPLNLKRVIFLEIVKALKEIPYLDFLWIPEKFQQAVINAPKPSYYREGLWLRLNELPREIERSGHAYYAHNGISALLIFLDGFPIENIIEQDKTLDELLGKCAVGNYLASMRAHHARWLEEERQKEIEEKKREEERKILKIKRAERRAELDRIRIEFPPRPQWERINDGKEEIHIFLRHFSELTHDDRLKVLADKDLQFPMDVIPKELVPKEASPDVLSPFEQENLVQNISHRKGPWRRLKSRLIAHLDRKEDTGERR